MKLFQKYGNIQNTNLASAQLIIAYVYATGLGVEQSLTKAREWIQKAAAQGNKKAIATLKQMDEDIRRTTTVERLNPSDRLVFG